MQVDKTKGYLKYNWEMAIAWEGDFSGEGQWWV